jgi:hypothetical protein
MTAAFSAYPEFGWFVLRFPHIFGAAAEGPKPFVYLVRRLADREDLEGAIERRFGDPRAAYLHVHFAAPGCYAAHRAGVSRLLPGCFAQGGVDAVLPARSIGLEKIEDVPVEAQRHRLLHARQ